MAWAPHISYTVGLCNTCSLNEFVSVALCLSPGLRLMFSLMDRVPDGITPMLHDLEEHIVSQGLADMLASASIITTVSTLRLSKTPLVTSANEIAHEECDRPPVV